MAFVSIGNYPDYKPLDVNLNECGLKYVPQHILRLKYSYKCFHNQYENIIRIFSDYSQPRRTKNDILTSNRIYKGRDIELGESPWTVYLSFRRDGKEVNGCTGSLITFEWVVTAAHCFEMSKIDDYDQLLVSGGTNQPMKGQIIEANNKTLVINANYTLDNRYDMAVIKLMSKFIRHQNNGLNYLVNTICLPEIRENNDREEKVTVFGYGLTDPFTKTTHMLKADMILSSDPENYILKAFTPDDSPTTCPGDSGAPLVQYLDRKRLRAVLVAIVESGHGETDCTRTIKYNKFVPVFKNIDWILETILNNNDL